MKYRLFLLCLMMIASFSATESKMFFQKKARRCRTAQECRDVTNACQCYCSQICGFRDKEPDDNPVYVENDPEGIYCYCKQWDLDNYISRCKGFVPMRSKKRLRIHQPK